VFDPTLESSDWGWFALNFVSTVKGLVFFCGANTGTKDFDEIDRCKLETYLCDFF
jgi:hypothetical protein